jgi:hypothetical protein
MYPLYQYVILSFSYLFGLKCPTAVGEIAVDEIIGFVDPPPGLYQLTLHVRDDKGDILLCVTVSLPLSGKARETSLMPAPLQLKARQR